MTTDGGTDGIITSVATDEGTDETTASVITDGGTDGATASVTNDRGTDGTIASVVTDRGNDGTTFLLILNYYCSYYCYINVSTLKLACSFATHIQGKEKGVGVR